MAIQVYEEEIFDALKKDLNKSREESWVTEIGMVITELNYMLKNLSQWVQPEIKRTNLQNLPSSSYVIREPLGVVLIISPWNYPFQLLINPLLGAIAAGNCAVCKPSEHAPATAAVCQKIISDTFSPDYISCIEGDGAVIIPELMHQFRFDHIFYTGGTAVGKIIYKTAAEKLVSVTLELGGKSPCIVEKDADLKVAARRIAIAKFSNSGQMCVAPDYVLVHESVRQRWLEHLATAVRKFFSDDPSTSYNYCRMINEKQFDRVSAYLNDGQLFMGGKTNRETLYIEPSVLVNVKKDAQVMKDEIFGPVLPVFGFQTKEEALSIISENENPLAFYVFTGSNSKAKDWVQSVPAGGGCINNCAWHLTNHHLPFGGRGNSGMGHYHGRQSFDTFSHKKSIMKTPTWFDPDIKYPPFKGRLKLFKWLIR